MTKEQILAALYVEISIRSKKQMKFLVYDLLKPLSAPEFYAFAYREIADILEKIFDDPDFSKEHLTEYDDPTSYAVDAIDDFEKENAERVLAFHNSRSYTPNT